MQGRSRIRSIFSSRWGLKLATQRRRIPSKKAEKNTSLLDSSSTTLTSPTPPCGSDTLVVILPPTSLSAHLTTQLTVCEVTGVKTLKLYLTDAIHLRDCLNDLLGSP